MTYLISSFNKAGKYRTLRLLLLFNLSFMVVNLKGMENSKDHRVRDFLPDIKPSYLSVILVSVCGILFLKNEATNDRLFVLEQNMAVLTEKCYVSGLKANEEKIVTYGSSETSERILISPTSSSSG